MSSPASQLVAAKVASDTKVKVETVVLKLLELSPMTDPELVQAYMNLVYIGQAPKTTDQNVRGRRKKLHELGLIHVVGVVPTESKRTARVWRKA
jgi:hypothetical protein